MSLFKTNTPSYRGQSNPPSQDSTWTEWLQKLLITPTPEYRQTPKAVLPASTDRNNEP